MNATQLKSAGFRLTWFRAMVFAGLAFAAGCWLTSRLMTPTVVAEASANRVYELRIYHTLPGRLPALVKRFKDDTRRIFDQHGISSVGYWVPQDDPIKSNTLVYIVSHPNREAATKNWKEFRDDPAWVKVAAASEADGKIVEKVDSTFMDPTDFSALK
jgi:hypothetical protein